MAQIVNDNDLTQKTTDNDARIVRSRLTAKTAKTVIFTIPRSLAKKYHLDEPTDMILFPRDDGILMRKLQVEDE